MPATTAITKENVRAVSVSANELVSVNAMLALLAETSPVLILGAAGVPCVSYAPSASTVSAIVADLTAQQTALTNQLTGYGITS